MRHAKLITAILTASCLFGFDSAARSQQQQQRESNGKAPQAPQAERKANQRAENNKNAAAEMFDKASVETMAAQCVRLDTEAGAIELEMFAETSPETVRNFLNLVALKAFDTTTFSRVVPNFVVQGGNLGTREKLTPELALRARRTIPDEPSQVRHVRGVVSMARGAEPNTATTNFFILVGDAPHLDNTFAGFGRVVRGIEVVDAINKAPVTGETPNKPVRLKTATLFACPAKTGDPAPAVKPLR